MHDKPIGDSRVVGVSCFYGLTASAAIVYSYAASFLPCRVYRT